MIGNQELKKILSFSVNKIEEFFGLFVDKETINKSKDFAEVKLAILKDCSITDFKHLSELSDSGS